MSIFAKIVTGIFGKKSDKDLKILNPYIDKINDDVIVNYIEGFHEHSSCKWTKS